MLYIICLLKSCTNFIEVSSHALFFFEILMFVRLLNHDRPNIFFYQNWQFHHLNVLLKYFYFHCLELTHDMLSGHRDRFYPMFRRLQKFFIDAGALTYVTALISVPKLPNVCTDRQVEFRNRQINRQTCQSYVWETGTSCEKCNSKAFWLGISNLLHRILTFIY